MQTRINLQAHRINQSMLDSTQRILVSGTSKWGNEQLTGRCENNRVVNFEGDKNLVGQFIDVKITEVLRNSLKAECL